MRGSTTHPRESIALVKAPRQEVHPPHGRHAAFGAEHRARAEAHAAYHHPSRRRVASKYADGAYDTVHPGENGLIVDPEDADALAEAIDSILSSEEIQRRYSQNCRQYIPQFEFEAVMQGYLQAIASVTSGNK